MFRLGEKREKKIEERKKAETMKSRPERRRGREKRK